MTRLREEQVHGAFSPHHLNLILFATERCNFRCTYCYESFLIGKMKRPVIDGVKALLERRAEDLDSLEISWFGGEPLVAKDVVQEVSAYASALASRIPNLEYTANMTTNGYFLDQTTVETLHAIGVRTYQVSLDGPADIHDRTRVQASGRGTFDQIWNNLRAIRDSELPVTVILRIHYSPTTWKLLDPLIEAVNAEFGQDRRFGVHFKSIEHLGGPNDQNFAVFSHEKSEAIKSVLDGRLRSPEQVYKLVPADWAYVCYASQANSLVVRADGSLGKCTVALYDDRNLIGQLYPDGTMHVDQSKFRPWLRGFETLDEVDLACPLMALSPSPLQNESPSRSPAVSLELGAGLAAHRTQAEAQQP